MVRIKLQNQSVTGPCHHDQHLHQFHMVDTDKSTHSQQRKLHQINSLFFLHKPIFLYRPAPIFQDFPTTPKVNVEYGSHGFQDKVMTPKTISSYDNYGRTIPSFDEIIPKPLSPAGKELLSLIQFKIIWSFVFFSLSKIYFAVVNAQKPSSH